MDNNRSPRKILNPATNRWVNINGKIGMEIRNKHTLRNTNPCWKGYHPIGTKQKNGRTVPNCVPK